LDSLSWGLHGRAAIAGTFHETDDLVTRHLEQVVVGEIQWAVYFACDWEGPTCGVDLGSGEVAADEVAFVGDDGDV